MGRTLHDEAHLHTVVTRHVTQCPGTNVHRHRHMSSYREKNVCGCLLTRETEKKKKEFSGYIGTGDYLRHLTSSIIGTPDVIYEVSYKCWPYHAGGEGKGGRESKRKKEKSSPQRDERQKMIFMTI